MGNEEIIKLVQKGIKKNRTNVVSQFSPALAVTHFLFLLIVVQFLDSHFIMMVIRSLIKITQMSDFLI